MLLSINGMTCAACVAQVERALVGGSGVREVSISLMGKRGQVFYSPDAVEPPELVRAINAVGFEAAEMTNKFDEGGTSRFTEEADYYRGQFFGSLPFSLGAITVSKIIPLAGPPAWQHFIMFDLIPGLTVQTVLVFLFVTPVQFGFGLPFFRRAYAALSNGAANMDVLVVLGDL